MSALLLPGVTLLGIGVVVLLVAYLFRRGSTTERQLRLIKIGAFLVVLGSAVTIVFIFGDAITQMPELAQ
ncbi:hypothetical protein [Pseudokineococcus sp. 1T1Z-3]|uniref:hypothetical protein n=1 Tax=Pseudokineococcus sp. 1T1Z-3 TaxID=3132745 RepID=UPI0030ADDD22